MAQTERGRKKPARTTPVPTDAEQFAEDLASDNPVTDQAASAPPAQPPNGEKVGFFTRINPKWIVGSGPMFPLLVLFGLNAVDELDSAAFGVLLPNIRDHFGLSLAGVALLTAIISPVRLLLELPVAYAADRWNRTRMAAVGAAIWAVFSAFTGLVWTVPLLYIARLGSSVGKLFNATHVSLLSDYYSIDSRARVFYAHSLANSVGQFAAPLIAGFVAFYFTWRVPFVMLAFPSVIFVLLALRLKEPKRGVHERLLAGADQETAETEEEAATVSETFRVLYNNRSARRIYMSLPFFTASTLGLGTFLSLFWSDVYNLNEAQRGILAALSEPIQVGSLIVGGIFVQRFVSRDPGLALRLVGASGLLSALSLAALALSPNIAVAIAANYVRAFVGALLGPAILAVISLAVPPRMRTFGFATGNLWFLLGLVAFPFIGAIGDRFGLRVGILIFVPIYLMGSFLLAAAGRHLNFDIHKVRVSALTQAEARKSRAEGRAKMLLVRGLDAGYDGVQVLFGVDFDVDDGEIIALLGTNGSGKSTLLKTISGLLEPDAGAIIYDGRDITSSDPVRISQLGIAQVPGGRAIFPTLSVGENMRVAGWLYRHDNKYLKEATERALEYFPILRDRWDQSAGSLSGGEQQMLSLAQAFIARPKLLLIDELTLGLAPTIVERLLKIVQAIHDNGTTIVLVEQSVNTALRIARRAVFMEKGEVRFSGPTAELLERPDILRSVYLQGAGAGLGAENKAAGADDDGGEVPLVDEATAKRALSSGIRDLDATRPMITSGDRPVVLETRGMTKRYGGITAVNDVSISLYEGEILGLIGPNGAGKTTLFDLITGFVPVDGGRVYLHGIDVTDKPTSERAKLGLGRSFQDARLWPALTVKEVLAVALERSIEERSALPAVFGFPSVWDSEANIERRSEELIELLGLGAFRDKFISELSTGSRRIVEIACMLAHRPSVLILDEPSSGIAQKETEALDPLLRQVKQYMGCSLLVIEHSMPLITGLAHRMIALDQGMYVTEGTPEEVTSHPAVVESYLGGASDYDHLIGDEDEQDEAAEAPKRRRAAPKKTTRKRPRPSGTAASRSGGTRSRSASSTSRARSSSAKPASTARKRSTSTSRTRREPD